MILRLKLVTPSVIRAMYWCLWTSGAGVSCRASACHYFFFFSSRRRHTRCGRDWSSDVCSSDLIRKKVEHRELRQGQSCRVQGRLEPRLDHVRRAQKREDEGVGRRAARAFSGTLAHALIMAHSRAVGHSAPAARYSCTVRTPTVKVMNYASSKFPPLPGNRATTRSIASHMNGSRDPTRSAA